MCLLAASTGFCANFDENRTIAIANTPKMNFQEFMKFAYTSGDGIHDLTVEGVCDEKTFIKLSEDKKHPFKKRLTHNGSMCLKLRKEGGCKDFHIRMTATGNTQVCVKNIMFAKKCKTIKTRKRKSFCGKFI